MQCGIQKKTLNNIEITMKNRRILGGNNMNNKSGINEKSTMTCYVSLVGPKASLNTLSATYLA